MTEHDEKDRAPSLWAPLAYRDLRLVWGGFLVSYIGDVIQIQAQAWLVVTQLSRSGLSLGAIALVQSLPRLLLSLFSGVLVDRFDKRKLLVVTQLLALAQSLVFLALYLGGRITFTSVLILAAALGVFDAVNLTARTALVPMLVPRSLLPQTVALQSLSTNVTQIVGPALTATLLGVFGVGGCLVANAITFAVLALAVVFARLPPVPVSRGKSVSADIRDGLAIVRGNSSLWANIVLAYCLGFFGMPVLRLLALYARTVLGTDARGFGALGVAIGIGAIAASIFVTARTTPSRLPRNIIAGCSGFVASIGIAACLRSLVPALLVFLVLGFAHMASRSAMVMMIQLEVSDSARGRVMSLLLADSAMVSLGGATFGWVADCLARHLAGGSADGSTALGRALSLTFLGLTGVCVIVLVLLGPTLWRARARLALDPIQPRAAE
jgi:MFS family permease